MHDHATVAQFIWNVADLLRGPYRPPQYERVMLPMTVLRRFDCVLAPTKAAVLAKAATVGEKKTGHALDVVLDAVAGQRFHNHSPLDFQKLLGDSEQLKLHLMSYINGFSANVRRIFEFFDFSKEIEKMDDSKILFEVVQAFAKMDLSPAKVSNAMMGLAFENLIRRFNESANETAGDHFTPREVIRLMVGILFADDDALLSTPDTARKLLDPACGTGGMLAEAQNYLREHHPEARLFVYGQDYNPRAYATAAADMLIKAVDHNGSGESVRFGDIFTEDRFAGEKFDYLLANPPFGVDWKRYQREINDEKEKQGFAGRFGAGLPRVNDGSLLFLQHMISKFQPYDPKKQQDGSRLAIVLSGSPLFTGGAGSGESEIRKWIIENDWLDAIIALPEQMFYNTGIGTYVWIVTNRKATHRKGKVQLIDARDQWESLRRSQGDKRREISEAQIADIVRLYGEFAEGPASKIFANKAFGYTRVTVERPLRLRFEITDKARAMFLQAFPHLAADLVAIEAAVPAVSPDWPAVLKQVDGVLAQRGSKWKAPEKKGFRSVFAHVDPTAEPAPGEPDPDLRDFENVPLLEDVDAYFAREVKPHVPDAWMDRSKDKVGYEIGFNRYFYRYTPPRALEVIDAELKAAEAEILKLLAEVTE
jgi:type I restriction enzyme M protein